MKNPNGYGSVVKLQDMGNKRFTGHDIYRTMTMNPNALATEETLLWDRCEEESDH